MNYCYNLELMKMHLCILAVSDGLMTILYLQNVSGRGELPTPPTHDSTLSKMVSQILFVCLDAVYA